jgi:hypothetical protein
MHRFMSADCKDRVSELLVQYRREADERQQYRYRLLAHTSENKLKIDSLLLASLSTALI